MERKELLNLLEEILNGYVDVKLEGSLEISVLTATFVINEINVVLKEKVCWNIDHCNRYHYIYVGDVEITLGWFQRRQLKRILRKLRRVHANKISRGLLSNESGALDSLDGGKR